MGLCSSIHRDPESKNMKSRLSFGSKTNNLVIPPSPVKEKPQNRNFRIDDIGLKSQWTPSRSTTTFTDNGSKEEAFFDSKAWLDSDCEDDFYSVKGDFTPSRGNTPVHTFGTPIVNKTPYENRISGSMPDSSPTQKKKLFQLFRESIRDDQDDDNENTSINGKKGVKTTIHDVLPKSTQGTPHISGANSACSSERTMSEDHVSVREKSVKSVQCCFPGLGSCRSFSERFRKPSSGPAIAANGKP